MQCVLKTFCLDKETLISLCRSPGVGEGVLWTAKTVGSSSLGGGQKDPPNQLLKSEKTSVFRDWYVSFAVSPFSLSFLCFSVLQNRPCMQNFNNQRHLISYLISYELYIDIYIFNYSCAISRLVLSIFRGAKLVQRDPKAHRDPQVQKGQRSRYRSS